MTTPRILLFDSGMGGLTVATCVRAQLPNAELIYAADNAGFPYGAWKEEALLPGLFMSWVRSSRKPGRMWW